MSNLTIVKVENNRYVAQPVFQWDRNQILKIYGLSLPSIPEVHFANSDMGHAIVKQASMDSAGIVTVDIPNSLLQKPYKINVFVCTYEGGTFQSQYHLELQVKARPKPLDYTLDVTDGEVYSFNALENQIANVQTKIDEAESAYLNAKTIYDLGPKFTRVDAIRSNGSITGLGDDSYASLTLFMLDVDATLGGAYVGKRRILDKVGLSIMTPSGSDVTIPQYINNLKFDISSVADDTLYVLGNKAVVCKAVVSDGTSELRYGTVSLTNYQGTLTVSIVLNDAIENVKGGYSVVFFM